MMIAPGLFQFWPWHKSPLASLHRGLQYTGRADCMELRQLVIFINIDLLLNKAEVVVFANHFRHSLGLEEGQHIGELVVQRAWGELLRIAQKRSETQEILPLTFLKKGVVAGLLEITEGDATAPPCFSLPGELDVLKEIVRGRP